MQWFEVDRNGLAQLLERKGKEFVLFELIQNAWDEETSEVQVTLERIPGTRRVRLTVTDDNPGGFEDLTHAFTLFAESAKKSDATKRGRFNAGEKLVLALCDEAQIASTRGTIVFDSTGRHLKRSKTDRGSIFTGTLKMTNEELEQCANAVRTLIAPAGIKTYFNGALLEAHKPAAVVEATLATEVANAEGQLKATQRKTTVEIYEPLPGQTAMLFEMGIPVVATDDRWHINIMQKVPLNMDRDNVTPAYLAKVRAIAVEAMRAELTPDDANSAWVREALQRHGDELATETVNTLVTLRFGEKRVIYDPSDLEANSLAASRGYTVVHGSQLGGAEWKAIRRTGAILPAGRVTPSPRPYQEGGELQKFLPQDSWTPAMKGVADYATRIGAKLLGKEIEVKVVSDISWPFAATFGPSGTLTLNLGRLGHKWFEGPLERVNDLLLHEFGHGIASNHLSQDYHDALTMLGARMVRLALEEPSLFALSRTPACVTG